MENQNDSIIFCVNCGQKVSLKSNFCWKCGSKIDKADENKGSGKILNDNISKDLEANKILEKKNTKPELKIYNQTKSEKFILLVILVILITIFVLIVDPPDFSPITNIFKGKFIGKVVCIKFPNEKNGTYGEGWNRKYYSNSWTGLVKSYKKNDYIDIQSLDGFHKTLAEESRLNLKDRIYSITILADNIDEYFNR